MPSTGPHFVETILAAVAEALLGSEPGHATAAGENIYRGRIDPLQPPELPAACIFMGQDDPIGDEGRDNATFFDSVLSVRIELGVRAVDLALVDTELNLLRRHVHAALMADRTLGLGGSVPGVIDLWPEGAEEPVLVREGNKPIASMVTNWAVRYRAPEDDPGTPEP